MPFILVYLLLPDARMGASFDSLAYSSDLALVLQFRVAAALSNTLAQSASCDLAQVMYLPIRAPTMANIIIR